MRPGIEKHLVPLLHFKGHADLGRWHRKWNLVVSAMEHECETFSEINRLQLNGAYSQLCLPTARVDGVAMRGMLSRVIHKAALLDPLHPGIADYARSLMPAGGWSLCPVDPFVYEHPERAAWWRTFKKRPAELRAFQPKTGTLVYPFLIHDGGRPEHDLLRKINAAVPAGIMGDLRADICQDLAVGILCGDLNEADLHAPAKEMIRKFKRLFPTKWGPISLDAVVPGTDGLRLIDTI